ncbi:hypothetical protein B0H14DRAFT_3493936 [Mycena olivaceomarginata]|nr:hypothetical protein B0H14DRAFT_3493936 [Mycena olivaceomarginata]
MHYACKVIDKKLMEGKEYMVRNEIAVLTRISSGNCNIVTLHDYFENQPVAHQKSSVVLGSEQACLRTREPVILGEKLPK